MKVTNFWAVNFLGYLFLIAGIAGMVADFVSRAVSAFPLNMGLHAGNGALIGVGLIGTTAANSLRDLDRRLRQIERVQTRS